MNAKCCSATFKAYRLLYVLPSLALKKFAWWLHCICIFCMAFTTNSTFCLLHH